MSFKKDHYAVLGVLPDAEDVVVAAAYRALASLYHPDRWKGDAIEATRRMAEINVAYGTLSDAVKRNAYDSSCNSSHRSVDFSDGQQDEAFDSALIELEARWQVAVSIFPDLVDIRRRLEKTAHRLAFAFVIVMLEKKLFSSRISVADAMENEFLEKHFGTNKQIIAFAKELIACSHKDAIVALNQYVDVLGSDIDPSPLIAKVDMDYKVSEKQGNANGVNLAPITDTKTLAEIARLKRVIRNFPGASDEAQKLASLLGYDVSISGSKIFSLLPIEFKYEVSVKATNEHIVQLPDSSSFCKWVGVNLCK